MSKEDLRHTLATAGLDSETYTELMSIISEATDAISAKHQIEDFLRNSISLDEIELEMLDFVKNKAQEYI